MAARTAAYLFIAFFFGGFVRTGIHDAFLYQRTHRETREIRKQFGFWKWLFLSYRDAKNCHAPLHMKLFWSIRCLNWLFCILEVCGLILASVFPSMQSDIDAAMKLTFRIMLAGCYIPMNIYSFILSGDKNNPKGWNFDAVKWK